MRHYEAALAGWADAVGDLLKCEGAVFFWRGAEGAWFGFEGFQAEAGEGCGVLLI